jgi:Domain of unknown function (DUF3576)
MPGMFGRNAMLRMATVLSLLPAALFALSACESSAPRDAYPEAERKKPGSGYYAQGSVLGEGGINLFGGGKKSDDGAGGSGIGVNSFLWRASLDTLAFMPLASADPFGGVIITDWYSPPAAQGERFKATAYILGRQLRTDGIRINIFRQVQRNGQWVDAPVAPATTGEIEDKVLARARELRSQTASNS